MEEGTQIYLLGAILLTIFFLISLSPKSKINSDGKGGIDKMSLNLHAIIVGIAWIIFFARYFYISVYGVPDL